MKWRNEQIYHLRQTEPLTKKDQDLYFEKVVLKLFDEERPNQILFSFLEDGVCIGYGGLVHINWIDQNSEISFIMDTTLEKVRFQEIWFSFLRLIENVAFHDLSFHKIYTYAFDLRPHLYEALTAAGFFKDAILRDHAIYEGRAVDVIIHSKINQRTHLVQASDTDTEITYKWISDNKIRQFSFTKGEISFEDHARWFSNKLQDSNCLYYILQKGAQKIGSVRIDYNELTGTGHISYLINSYFHGLGYGTRILQLIEELILTKYKVICLKGLVMKSNEASVRIFQKLGYNLELDQGNILTFSKTIKK
jgi:RimJ/RimL family protein N-acetyltransferase